MSDVVEDTYYVWVTSVTDVYTEQVVGRLVRRNWRVRSLGNSLSLHNQDNMASLVSLSVSKKPADDTEVIDETYVLAEVRDVLKVLKVRHYSIVVTRGTGCTWCLGNVSESETQKLVEAQKRSTN